MSETQFSFRPDDEEPLFLDSQPRQPVVAAPTGSLYLDRPPTRQARQGRGRFPLILASVGVFLLAAGGAALLLEPPQAVRDLVARFLPAAPAASGESPSAAEVQAPPVDPDMAAAAAAASEAAAEATRAEAAPPPPEPETVPAPKAQASPPKTPERAKPVSRKRPAHSAPKPRSLDLDALERSLPSGE